MVLWSTMLFLALTDTQCRKENFRQCMARCGNTGFEMTLKNNCDVCKCVCDRVLPADCKAHCQKTMKSGFVITKNYFGCHQCKCHSCPKLTCSQDCPLGFKIVNGCPTCDCVCAPRRVTIKRCIKYKRDENNCETNHCAKYKCPTPNEMQCSKNCVKYATDPRTKCPTCDCATTPKDTATSSVAAHVNELNQRDENCPKYSCSDKACPNLFRRIDRNNCITCECCPSRLLKNCPLVCANGYKRDFWGCPTCSCLEHKEVCACRCGINDQPESEL